MSSVPLKRLYKELPVWIVEDHHDVSLAHWHALTRYSPPFWVNRRLNRGKTCHNIVHRHSLVTSDTKTNELVNGELISFTNQQFMRLYRKCGLAADSPDYLLISPNYVLMLKLLLDMSSFMSCWEASCW